MNEPVRTAAEIPNGASQAEQEVLKITQELTDATVRNDVDAVGRIYGDDYLFVAFNGNLENKESQLEAFRSGFMKFSAATIEDVVVRVYGDTAVAIKRRTQVATVGTRTNPGARPRVTSVWVKRQGRWQLVSGQVTPTLENPPAQTETNNAGASGQTRTMDDEAAIRKHVADYVLAYNTHDWEKMGALFTDDGDGLRSGRLAKGRSALRDLFIQSHSTTAKTSHLTHGREHSLPETRCCGG